MEIYHDDIFGGHRNADTTYQRIARRYCWPFMRREITEWVQSCVACQTKKRPKENIKQPMRQIPVYGPFFA